MGTDRIRALLDDGRRSGGALLPYLTAGFPDRRVTESLIRRCDELGARVIEIGIPYSDSIADGPVIQSSFNHALASGFRLNDVFHVIERVRGEVSCGLMAMVSFSIVHRAGMIDFITRAARSGFDGVILPDLPLEEAGPVRAVVEQAGLAYIGLVAPTTSRERRMRIVRSSSGFVYQIASAGLTGERADLDAKLADEVAVLRQVGGLPVCVGFGISTAEQVRQVCSFADGAIVGSAIVRRVSEGVGAGLDRDDLVERVGAFVGELMTGVTSNGRPRG